MANYMEQVAKMLGVEMGEKYDIVFPDSNTCHATVMFTNEGVKTIETNVYDVYNFKAYVLTNLLTGLYGLKRKPWKPCNTDIFWYVSPIGRAFCESWMENTTFNLNLYKIGNCYKTCKEAEANIDKWLAFYKSDEVLEV